MKNFKIEDMVNGWFVGDFNPVAFKSKIFEAAIKKYPSGAYEERHFHKIATEITVIVEGIVKMNGVILEAGSIVIINPNEATDFHCITDVTTCVIKTPASIGDKYKT